MSVCSFFEGVGVLVEKKLIDIELVWGLLRISIVQIHETIVQFYPIWRVNYRLKTIGLHFEMLYHEIQKYNEQNPLPKDLSK